MIKLNGKIINITVFPDNTSQVWKINNIESLKKAKIEWFAVNEGEFLQIAQLKALLDSLNIYNVELYIDYLPYARQDKPVDNNLTFGLYPFAKLLNSLNFKKVTILDPHSKEALRLINNSFPIYPIDKINKMINELNIDYICYPDKGAFEKYSTEYKINKPIIIGHKIRDQSNGKIKEYKIEFSSNTLKFRNILIIDDICDGGATFKELAKVLTNNLTPASVNLFITHGIFSKGALGINELKKSGINKIITNKGEVKIIHSDIIAFSISQ